MGEKQLGSDGRATTIVFGVLALLIAIVSCAPDGGEGRAPKVLVIGIDGVRADVMAEVPTPRLDALAATGVFTDRARTTIPSVSGPAWSSMLTGVWPPKHRVTSNAFTEPDYASYPDFLTRVERARPDARTFAVADWKPLGSLPDNDPLLSDRIDARFVLDGSEMGWRQADSASVALALSEIRGEDPDAMFVYLGNPDETSHHHGSIGPEYRTSISLADHQVGQLVDAVRARETFGAEDWLILVSTDHGRRDDGGHGGVSPEEMTIFLIASGGDVGGLASADPAIVDVAVTALAHLGVVDVPEGALDGQVFASGPSD